MGERHLRAVLRYGSVRKLQNLALCEWEKARRVARPRSMPYSAPIDVTNACNLRCPHCPTGAGITGRPATMLRLETLSRFLHEVGDYLFMAHLFNWGETLLHPQAAEVIRLVHERRVFTSMASHLSVKRAGGMDDVVDAGLDHLIASIDGATSETYGAYRRRGNLELVLENLSRVLERRRKTRRRTPTVDWQFIVFRHNEHEIEKARALAQRMGVDTFTLKRPTAPPESLSETPSYGGQFYGGSRFCGQLWHNVVLQADGGIAPCCNLYVPEDDFGSLVPAGATVREIRTSSRYAAARQFFDASAVPEPSAGEHPCVRCPIVRSQEYLQEWIAARPMARRQDVMGVVPIGRGRPERRGSP